MNKLYLQSTTTMQFQRSLLPAFMALATLLMCAMPTFATTASATSTIELVSGSDYLEVPCDEYDSETPYGDLVFQDTACPSSEITVVILSDVQVSGSCAESFIRQYEVSSDCGNTLTFSQLLNLTDNTDPIITITAPADYVSYTGADCQADTSVPLTGTATYTVDDNCDENVNVELTYEDNELQGDCEGAYSIARTWTATAVDHCDNIAQVSVTQMITVENNIGPTFDNAPEDIVIACTDDFPSIPTLTASGNCEDSNSDGTTTVIFAGQTPQYDVECTGTYKVDRTWIAEDCSGNQTSHIQTITVIDDIAPEISGGADYTAECDGSGNTAELNAWLANNGGATATDNCGTIAWTNDFFGLSDDCGATGTADVTFTAMDDCMNASTITLTFTIEDTQAPELNASPTYEIACDEYDPQGIYSASENDMCGDVELVLVSVFELSGSCALSYLHTYKAVDDCGNESEPFSQLVNLLDETSPEVVITCPADYVTSADEDCVADTSPAAAGEAIASATDNCDSEPVITLTYSDGPVEYNCEGGYSFVRTWTAVAEDHCANEGSTSCDQLITVIDEIGPGLDFSASDLVLDCEGADSLADIDGWLEIHGGAVAWDNCYVGEFAWSHDYAGLETLCPNDSLEVVFSVSDDCGNTTTTSAFIVLQGACTTDSNDNGLCDFTEVQGCMDPIALNYNADATLSDVCEYVPANCIPVFDPAIQDTVAVACVDDLPLEAPEQYAYDPCSPGEPALDILSSMLAIDTVTPCGQFVTYRYLALNLTYGLIAVQEQTWMVMDTVGPMISSVPEDLVIACTDDSTAYGMIEAADACHDVFSIEYTIDSLYVDTLSMPVCPGNYLIARTVTATDVCGNANAASYVITVRDTVGPELGNIPMDDTLSCEMAIPVETPIHLDACSGSELSVTTAEQPGLCPENYTLIRTFVAQDQCGNSSAAIQEVTFIDTLAPAILTTPADLLLSCVEMVPDSAITAGDNCSTIEISSLDSIVMGACPQEYTILRTHTAMDACGNGATHVQSIAVVDTVAPAFSMLEAFVTATCAEADEVLAAAEDTCSAVTVAFSTFNAAGSAGMPGQQVRLYTASDECGNAAEGIQLVTFSNAEACAGCMNETAMNYDPTAVIDDGSCDFGGIYNEAGECILDEDEDGVCDQLEIAGCQDPMACNYVAIATDPADCVYPEDPTRDCTGVCLNDEDGDGICDENEVEGCQDTNACNFNLYATDSDPALCDYGCVGCTYSEATNYDAGSTVDDGSCEFDLEEGGATTCNGDADGDGQVGILDLLDVLDSFGTYCD